jgi:hypothetical protein
MKNLNYNLLLTFTLLTGLPRAGAQGLTFTNQAVSVGDGPACIAVADINADGRLDLVSANAGDSTLTVLTNGVSGVFGANATFDVGTAPEAVVATDVNGDGEPDLVSANNGDGSLTIVTNNGSGTFGFNATLSVFSAPHGVAAADVNGDGRTDLISVNSGSFVEDFIGTLTVLTNNGSGIFGSNAILNVGRSPYAVVAADFNGDGKPDLASADSSDHTVTILTNNGIGVFYSSAVLDVGSYPISIVAADVNGDARPDLVTADSSDPGALYVLTNDGSGNFTLAATPEVGSLPNSVLAADVNGDGKLDLISANFGNDPSTLTVLTNSGSGVFGLNTTLTVGNSAYYVTAADLNADGKLDLISANNGSDSLTVLQNTSPFPSPSPAPALTQSATGQNIHVSWPSATPGWSLQQAGVLTQNPWLPSGYGGYEIKDDGTNRSLTLPMTRKSQFFKLLHP